MLTSLNMLTNAQYVDKIQVVTCMTIGGADNSRMTTLRGQPTTSAIVRLCSAVCDSIDSPVYQSTSHGHSRGQISNAPQGLESSGPLRTFLCISFNSSSQPTVLEALPDSLLYTSVEGMDRGLGAAGWHRELPVAPDSTFSNDLSSESSDDESP